MEAVKRIIGLLIVATIIFGTVSCLVRLFCWSFDLGWSWRYPVGVCAASTLVALTLSAVRYK